MKAKGYCAQHLP
jgi:hypothetical protein